MRLFSRGFDSVEAEAHDILQDEFSSAWSHQPCETRPNYQARPDPSKPAKHIRGVFDNAGRHIKLGMEEAGVSTQEPCLTVRLCDLVYPLKTGDRFINCANGMSYEVTDKKPDGMSGLEISLVLLGREP